MSFEVSVVVIAYNSRATISETLRSVADQAYNLKKVELIISDDGSSDGTFELAREWVLGNEGLFGKVSLISANVNQGVARNCNKAWREATGKWIKTIAADDVLSKDCLSKNMEFISENPSAAIVFSKCSVFIDDWRNGSTEIELDHDFFNLDANAQNKALLVSCEIKAPTAFIKRSVLSSVGYATERYSMIEDYPLWFKLTKAGFKLEAFDSVTVYYRIGDSLSNRHKRIANLNYISSLYLFQREIIWPLLPWQMFLKRWDDIVLYYERYLGVVYLGNKKSWLYDFLRATSFLIRPYRVYRQLLNLTKRASI